MRPSRVRAAGIRTAHTNFAIATICVLLVTASAVAGRRADHPARIDGTPFVELADPTGELVEVNLSGKLLKLLTSRAIKRHDADVAAILADLVSVHAVVAEIDEKYRDDARRKIRDTGKELIRKEWERFVRVREGDGEYAAYVHFDRKEEVDGIVVMGFIEEDELIFVNLAGRVNMERIAVLGDRLGVPGLDDLPTTFEIDERRKSIEGRTRDQG